MKLEDYKAMTIFEQNVIDILSKMQVNLQAIYNLITNDDMENHK